MARSLRWAALGLGAVLVVAGCSTGGTATVEQDPKAPLELWTRTKPGGDGEKGMKKLAAAFEAKTGQKVQVTAIFDDFETKLSQRAAQKDLPDIVMNDSAQLGSMVSEGIVREVDPAAVPGSDQLIETALASARAGDGKLYGIPYSAQASALLIRKDWRQKAGLPAPKTLDQFVALAKAFTTQDPDGNGKNDTFGLAVPGSTKRGYASWYFSNFIWASGRRLHHQAGRREVQAGHVDAGVRGRHQVVPRPGLHEQGRPARCRDDGHAAHQRDLRGRQDRHVRRRPVPDAAVRQVARQGQVRGRTGPAGCEGRDRAGRGRQRLHDGRLGERGRSELVRLPS